MLFVVVISTALLLTTSGQLINKTKNLQVRDDITWKVVGGSTAATGQFPYIVSIRDSYNRHFCGGSIINQNYVLTAAHCMVGVYPGNVLLVVGTNTLNWGGTSYRASHVRIHPQFDGNVQNKDDIALIHLASPIQFTSAVQPVTMDTGSAGNSVCTLSGWGSTYLGSQSPNYLQYITLRSLSTSECQRYLPEVGGTQICTLTTYGQGACHGDSGGPLVSNGYLVGVVSYGRPCAKGMPDVFTRVATYVGWIRANMNY